MLSFQHFPLLSALSCLLKMLALPVKVLCKLKNLSFMSLQPRINQHWCQEGPSCPPFTPCLSPYSQPFSSCQL